MFACCLQTNRFVNLLTCHMFLPPEMLSIISFNNSVKFTQKMNKKMCSYHQLRPLNWPVLNLPQRTSFSQTAAYMYKSKLNLNASFSLIEFSPVNKVAKDQSVSSCSTWSRSIRTCHREETCDESLLKHISSLLLCLKNNIRVWETTRPLSDPLTPGQSHVCTTKVSRTVKLLFWKMTKSRPARGRFQMLRG